MIVRNCLFKFALDTVIKSPQGLRQFQRLYQKLKKGLEKDIKESDLDMKITNLAIIHIKFPFYWNIP